MFSRSGCSHFRRFESRFSRVDLKERGREGGHDNVHRKKRRGRRENVRVSVVFTCACGGYASGKRLFLLVLLFL